MIAIDANLAEVVREVADRLFCTPDEAACGLIRLCLASHTHTIKESDATEMLADVLDDWGYQAVEWNKWVRRGKEGLS